MTVPDLRIVVAQPPRRGQLDGGIPRFSRLLAEGLRTTSLAQIDEVPLADAVAPAGGAVLAQFGAGSQFTSRSHRRHLRRLARDSGALHVFLHDVGGVGYPGLRSLLA